MFDPEGATAGAASVALLASAAVPTPAAAAPAAAARDLLERDGFGGAAAAAAGTVSGGGAGFERDEVAFGDGVAVFEAPGVLAAELDFGGAFFVAAGLVAVEALAAVFGAPGAFLAAGPFFSTGAFESAATAVGGVAVFRVAFGFAAGTAGVDPFDGVVDAVGVVASASLFAEAPLRGRLFDVIASLSPRARPFCANPGTPGRAPAGRGMSVVGRAR